MNKKAKLSLLLSALMLLFFTAAAQAGRGREIMEVMDKLDQGFHDEVSQLKMVLINAHGDKVERLMATKRFEVKDDGDKSINKFLKPRDIKGTGLLTYEHKVGDDDQWLYLPALKRIKRISSRKKTGSFMGSEFSFEDLSSFDIDKFKYKYLKEETIDGVPCFVIERYPVDTYSGYTRQVAYVRRDNHQFKKIEYYDRKSDLLKIASYEDFQKIGRFWRPTRIDMKNVQTKKETVIDFMETKIQNGLKKSDFSKRALKKR
ncbi:MAG: outer membrane lipoprotein-sorting protein [bacterium]